MVCLWPIFLASPNQCLSKEVEPTSDLTEIFQQFLLKSNVGLVNEGKIQILLIPREHDKS